MKREKVLEKAREFDAILGIAHTITIFFLLITPRRKDAKFLYASSSYCFISLDNESDLDEKKRIFQTTTWRTMRSWRLSQPIVSGRVCMSNFPEIFHVNRVSASLR